MNLARGSGLLVDVDAVVDGVGVVDSRNKTVGIGVEARVEKRVRRSEV